jgi:hypothetical protein
MPATLSDKIRNAPKGSRMRALFDDSTDDESHNEMTAAYNSQKSQATWVDTQPPPGIQTQPDHYSIPRKCNNEKMKSVDDRCQTPQPKPRQIIIADTPDSVRNFNPNRTIEMSATNTKVETGNSVNQNDAQSLEWDTTTSGTPRKSARVSLSPNAAKSRTKVTNVSSLEALDPPPVPQSGGRESTESKVAIKRRIDASDTGNHGVLCAGQSGSPVSKKRKTTMASAMSELVKATVDVNYTPREPAEEKPPTMRKKRQTKVERVENDASAIAASKTKSKRTTKPAADPPNASPLENLTLDEAEVGPEVGPVAKKPRGSPHARNISKPKQGSSDLSSKPDPLETAKVADTAVQRDPSPVETGKPGRTRASPASGSAKESSTVEVPNAATSLMSHKKANVRREMETSKNAESQEFLGKSIAPAAPSQIENKRDLPGSAASIVKPKKKRTFQDQVLAEMFFSCKAYNLKSLAQSLSTTEIALQYLMLSLLDKNIVVKKDFTSKSGKTKEIYWANQESKAKEVMNLMPDAGEMEEASNELTSLQRLQSEIAQEMAILSQDLSNEEIDAQLHQMETEVTETKANLLALQTRIKNYQEGKRPVRPFGRLLQNQTTPAQMAKENCPRRTAMRINFMRDEWKARKQKCMDFVERLADGMEKKPKDVIKLLEIETDEMERVTMPPKRVIETSGPSK